MLFAVQVFHLFSSPKLLTNPFIMLAIFSWHISTAVIFSRYYQPTKTDCRLLKISLAFENKYHSWWLKKWKVGVFASLALYLDAAEMRWLKRCYDKSTTAVTSHCLCIYVCICVQCRKLSDGLFLECCRSVAEEYPSVKFESMIIDNTCMQARDRLLRSPLSGSVILPTVCYH